MVVVPASRHRSPTAGTGRRPGTPMVPRRRRGLRLSTRVTLSFGLIALLAGAGLTVMTYLIARNSLIEQRATAARVQAFSNARDVQLAYAEPAQLAEVVRRLPIEPGGFGALTEPRLQTRIGLGLEQFPAPLREAVIGGRSAQQRFELDGSPFLGVGIHLAAHDTAYFEAFPLEDTERTLRLVLTALLVGAGVTTLFATFSGWSTSRRLLRPLSRVADAAGDIASGALGARLQPADDPDLDRLAGSFNDMADAVQTRIEREVRFASDVSHELRSPITALTAAVEVLDARRDDLPERTQQALDVVVGQVRRFDDMVIDLLELARIDAGAAEINGEVVDLPELCSRIAAATGHPDVPIEVHRRAATSVWLDKIRFERILANLLDNAAAHAGGARRISIEPGPDGTTLLAVEDAGPGVAAGERERIFERFARGSAARHRIGTGLGLALVAEHARALGGDAWVEERAGGGARFVVQVRREAPR